MKIGYIKVSISDQNIVLQMDALEGAGYEKIFRDEGVSGSKRERSGLEETFAELKRATY
jgi:DNA invertase Pin-like site-specific DNA recombinase